MRMRNRRFKLSLLTWAVAMLIGMTILSGASAASSQTEPPSQDASPASDAEPATMPAGTSDSAPSDPIWLYSDDDRGCCVLKKYPMKSQWECSSTNYRNCKDTAKDMEIRFSFYKDKSCSDVDGC